MGGLDQVKQQLREAVEWPLGHPDLLRRAGVSPPRGILLYGPPGTGKTLLARALASQSGINVVSVKGPALLTKYVGESERAIRDLFKRARQSSPCLLLFDEIDALAPPRGGSGDEGHVASRVVAQLLTELDGIEDLEGVLVVGTTNRRDMVIRRCCAPTYRPLLEVTLLILPRAPRLRAWRRPPRMDVASLASARLVPAARRSRGSAPGRAVAVRRLVDRGTAAVGGDPLITGTTCRPRLKRRRQSHEEGGNRGTRDGWARGNDMHHEISPSPARVRAQRCPADIAMLVPAKPHPQGAFARAIHAAS